MVMFHFGLHTGKILTSANVFHVPDMCKNLISGDLNKKGFKLVYESNKFVLSKQGVLVGHGYSYNWMICMNLIKDNFVYVIESSISMCHSKLGHVNVNSIKNMVNLGLISEYNFTDIDKCQICIQSKIVFKSHKAVEGSTNILDLIHMDVCDLKNIVNQGENKFFVTFIDD